MHIGYYWLERWLKLMSPQAQKHPAADGESEEHAALKQEVSELQAALAEREQALQAGLQQRQEIEAELAAVRRAAEEERADHTRRDAELSRSAADAAKQLQAEQERRRDTQSQLQQAQEALQRAEAEQAAAQQECVRLQDKLAKVRRDATSERAALDNEIRAAQEQASRLRDELHAAEGERATAVHARERLENELAEVRAQAEQQRSAVSAAVPEPSPPVTAASPVKKPEQTESKKPRGLGKRATILKAAQPQTDDLVLHFQKPETWSEAVFVHYWDTDPPSQPPAWPGLPMTPEGDDWFVVSLRDIRGASLIFNDNAGRQTGNLHRDRSGWLDSDEKWHDEQPKRLRKGRSHPVPS